MKQNGNYIINPIFDFQSVCDTDLGLYRLIRKEYYDKSIFRKELFETNDLAFVKAMILTRSKFNPLSVFCKDNVLKEEEMNDLYEQFLEEEYDKILELSSPTTILSLASTSNNLNKMVNVRILCKSKNEVKWISKYTTKLKCIISPYKDFDLKKYDAVYLKDIYTLLQFKQDSIDKKNIILSKFNFNLESYKLELPIIEISKNYYKNNKLLLASPYKDIIAPVSEMI